MKTHPGVQAIIDRIVSDCRSYNAVTIESGHLDATTKMVSPPGSFTVTVSMDDPDGEQAAIEKEEKVAAKLMEATKAVRYRMKVGGARTFPLTDPECHQEVRDHDGCFTLYSGPSRVYEVRILSDTLGGITRTA